jgi:hypothetical protein
MLIYEKINDVQGKIGVQNELRHYLKKLFKYLTGAIYYGIGFRVPKKGMT